MMSAIKRMQRRLLLHHLPFSLAAVALCVPLYWTRPYKDVIARASFATAYPALLFLTLSLLIGPWNLLLKRRNPVSSDLRRDVGIWAGIFCLVHSAIGQCVHLRGRPWLYYIYDAKREHGHSFPFRHDLFGFSNDTGLLSALTVVLLLATSSDYALRKLGTPGWKRLQRWNYAAFALAAAHTIGYQWSQKQNLSFHVTAWTCIAVTVGMQAIGYWTRRSSRTTPITPEPGESLGAAPRRA